MIEDFISLIPKRALPLSGKVFYSGRHAFSAPSPVYLLGLNPGGAPNAMADETVQAHTEAVLRKFPSSWSAYADESWKGWPPGRSGLQPRVIHLLKRLGLDARSVPSSNVVFARSTRESTFIGSMAEMGVDAWPFHQRVIEQLGVRVVVCFGQTAGGWVSERLGASTPSGDFVEANNRRWRSFAMTNRAGVSVATLTHPSIADWTKPATDPSGLIRALMAR
jgi:hypothetical protein